MDIVAIQQRLSEMGFPTDSSKIEAIITAVKEGKKNKSIRYVSTDRHCGGKYPVADIAQVILNAKDHYHIGRVWKLATRRYPRLDEFVSKSSYAKTVRVSDHGWNKRGLKSLTLLGVIYFCAIVQYKAPNDSSVFEGNGIYVLKDPGNKLLKVGFSSRVYHRVLQHKSSNPSLTTLAIFSVDSIDAERDIHLALKAYRIKNTHEWYPDNLEVREAICSFFLQIGIDDPALAE